MACDTQDLPYHRCDPSPDLKCTYDAQSLEDSDTTTGELVKDVMHLYNDAVADAKAAIYFGCGFANTGESNRNDGVAGFCRNPLGLSYQLSSSLGFDNVFAHCFVRYDSSPHQASTFTIGAAQTTGVGYTPMVTSPAGEPCLYYVQLAGIKVGKQALKIDPAVFTLDPQGRSGTVIDSGSSLTYLTRVAFDAVVTAVQAQVKLPVFKGKYPLDLVLCYDRTGVATDSLVLPDLTFSFPGVDLFVSQQVAFFRFLGNSVCLGMLPADPVGPGSIGNIFMTNTYVVYDNKNTRMGFAQRDCSTAQA